MKRLNPAVFLDRDGTLIENKGYLSDPNQIRFYSSTFSALRRFQKAHFKLVVVSNQSGVGRGYFTLATLKKINQRFKQRLLKAGVRLDGIYFCPHSPRAGCLCRKPRPGLARRAMQDLDIDLAKSFVIGDSVVDMKLAKNLKVPGILVLTGGGRSGRSRSGRFAAKVTRNISTAADWVLSPPIFR